MTDLLMINLGKGNTAQHGALGYAETEYVFPDGTSQTTRLAGFALWSWLEAQGRAPVSVRFAATREVWEEKKERLPEEAAARGLDWAKVDEPLFVELPRSANDLWSFLPELEHWVGDHGEGGSAPVLHIDLTHAYRAIPLAQPWLALYLERLGLAEVGVLGYGAFVPGEPATPYIDMAHVMVLAEWAAGVRDFERFGRAGALSRLMREKENFWRNLVYGKGTRRDAAPLLKKLRGLVHAAGAMDRYLPAGLPIELGLAVRSALGDPAADDVSEAVEALLPGTRPLAERLHRAAGRFAWREPVRGKGQKSDRAVLTRGELERQLELVSYWAELGAVGDALRALRELLVSRVLLAWGRTTGWLEREPRETAEAALNALRPDTTGKADPHLPADLRTLGVLWHEVCEARNAFAHAGMKPEEVKPDAARARLESYIDRYRDLSGDEAIWNLEPPGQE